MEAISCWKAWQFALWSARFDGAWALWGARFVAMNMTNFVSHFVDHLVACWRRLNIDNLWLTFWNIRWSNNGSR